MSINTQDFIVIDGALVLGKPKPEVVFSEGDLVLPQVRIPFKRPAFCDQVCRVTKVEDGRIYATLTKWNKVPAWPFRARELVLLQVGGSDYAIN